MSEILATVTLKLVRVNLSYHLIYAAIFVNIIFLTMHLLPRMNVYWPSRAARSAKEAKEIHNEKFLATI